MVMVRLAKALTTSPIGVGVSAHKHQWSS